LLEVSICVFINRLQIDEQESPNVAVNYTSTKVVQADFLVVEVLLVGEEVQEFKIYK